MNEKNVFQIKDKVSAITHFIGFILSIFSMPILLIRGAILQHGVIDLISLSIFSLSMIFLYLASTCYHTFKLESERGNRILHKIDHAMITFLIAGTYTPLLIILPKTKLSSILLVVIWVLALLSTIFKIAWVTSPKWLNSLIYVLMGWAFLPIAGAIYHGLTLIGFVLLLLGGVFYTTGAIIYAIKPKRIEKNKNFKSHEIFHLFTLGGTFSLYFMILFYVI